MLTMSVKAPFSLYFQQSTEFISILVNELPYVGESELENSIGRRFRINALLLRVSFRIEKMSISAQWPGLRVASTHADPNDPLWESP